MTIRLCYTFGALTGALADETFNTRFHAFEIEVRRNGLEGTFGTRMAKDFVVPSDDVIDECSRKANFGVIKYDGLAMDLKLFVVGSSEKGLKIGIIGLVSGDDGIVNWTDWVVVVVIVIESKGLYIFRGNRVHWISTKEVGNKIVFSRSIYKSIVILLEQKTPTANTLRTEGVKAQILMI